MYGLEKDKEKKKRDRFVFDLELQLKESPKKAKELIEKVDKHTQEIKKVLREGASEKDFEDLGLLLHAYTALHKVIKKATK